MSQDGSLARRIITRLSAAIGELPAMMIGGQRFGLSALAAMPSDDRRQWGVNVADAIEQFLKAVDKGRNVIVFKAHREPETAITVLPESDWIVIQIVEYSEHTEVIANEHGVIKPLMTTGMNMDEI